jgi:hypothetical protein
MPRRSQRRGLLVAAALVVIAGAIGAAALVERNDNGQTISAGGEDGGEPTGGAATPEADGSEQPAPTVLCEPGEELIEWNPSSLYEELAADTIDENAILTSAASYLEVELNELQLTDVTSMRAVVTLSDQGRMIAVVELRHLRPEASQEPAGWQPVYSARCVRPGGGPAPAACQGLVGCLATIEQPEGGWVFAEGEVDGATLEPYPGAEITLLFDGVRVAGQTGCNGYSIEADAEFGPVAEQAACFPVEVMQIETAYLAAIARTTSAYLVDGFLELAGDGVTLRYRAVGALGALDGRWELVAATVDNTSVDLSAPTVVTVTGSELTVELPCGTRNGTIGAEGVVLAEVEAPTEPVTCDHANLTATIEAAIGLSDRVTIEGPNLVMRSPQADLLFLPAPGGTIALSALVGPWAVSDGDDQAVLTLGPYGSFELTDTGCGPIQVAGEWQLTDDTLVVTPGPFRDPSCTDLYNEFAALLAERPAVSISADNRLTLSGSREVVLVRVVTAD